VSALVAERILVVEQEPEAGRIAHALDEAGFGVARVAILDDLAALAMQGVAGIVVGHRPPHDDGFAVLQQLRTRCIVAPILLVSPLESTELAVRAVKAGAHDFLAQGECYLPMLVAKMRAAVAEQAARAALGRVVRPVFVGRGTELRVLGEELGRAAAGEGRVVLIDGDEGIGKTSLALELSRLARGRGLRVLWGRCPDSGTAPAYWPWTQVLRRYAASVDTATLRADLGEHAAAIRCLVPSLHERHPALTAREQHELTHLHVTDGVIQVLKRVAARRPLVVVFDDLHRADGDTVHLLHALATECADSTILLLGIFRDGGAGPARTEADLARAGELARVASLPLTTVLHLEGFDVGDVQHYVEQATTVPASAAVARAIHAKTAGHPLFVAEVTRLLAADGRLAAEPGNGELRLAIPSTRRHAIAARLDRLSSGARRVLTAAAVLGFDFSTGLLAAVTGAEPGCVQRALEEAMAVALLATSDEDSGAFRFSHVLVREVLYEALGADERTRWHGRVVATLESSASASGLTRETTLTAIAHHALHAASDEAGLPRALTWVTAVAEHAAAMMAHAEAARYYEIALALGERAPLLTPADTGRLLLQLAEARWRTGDMASARAIGHRALVLAKKAEEPEAVAAAVLVFAGRLPGFGAIVSDAEVVGELEQALAILPKSAPTRPLVMARLAAELAYSPRRGAHQTLAYEAIELARGSADPTTLAAVLRTTQWSVWTPTDIEHRPHLATEIIACAERIDDRVLALDGQLLRLWSALEQGDIAAAWRQLTLCERSATALHLPHYVWVTAAARACLHFATGQLTEAERLAERASAVGVGAHDPTVALLLGAQRAQVHTMYGRFGEVTEWLRSVVTSFPVLASTLELWALVFYARTGQHDRVRAELAALVADDFVRVPRDALWLMNITSLATACVLAGATEAAGPLYRMLAPFTPYNVVVPPAFVLAPVSYYTAGLADLIGNPAIARRHYEDALTLAAETGSRQWTARIQIAFARLLLADRHAGARERGAQLLAAGRAIAVELGLAPAVQEADDVLARSAPVATVRAMFRPAGDTWQLEFRGRATTVPHRVGLTYLHCLLQRPGIPIAALELASLGGDGVLVEQSGGPLVDRRALGEVQRRLAEIDADIAGSARRGATVSAALLHERAQCAAYVGGRSTELVSTTDRARSGVTKAIGRALKAIRDVDDGLGHYLERHVETGRLCMYVPDPAAAPAFEL